MWSKALRRLRMKLVSLTGLGFRMSFEVERPRTGEARGVDMGEVAGITH